MITILMMLKYGALGAWLVYGYFESVKWFTDRKYKKASTGRP